MGISDSIRGFFKSPEPLERQIYKEAPGPRITARSRRGFRAYKNPASFNPTGLAGFDGFFQNNAYSNGYSLVHLNLIRVLIQTSPFLRAYIKQGQHSVVGNQGPTPSFAKVSNPTDKRRLEEAWKAWTEEVGVSGNDDFVAVLNSLMIAYLSDGRSLAVTKFDTDYNMGMGILPLSRDWIAGQFLGGAPSDKTVNGKTYKNRNGVIYKPNGRVYGFDVYKEDPCLSRTATNVGGFGYSRGMESVVVPFDMVCDFTTYAAPWNCDFVPEEILSIVDSIKHVTDLDGSMLKMMKTAVNRLGLGVVTQDPMAVPDSTQDFGEGDNEVETDDPPLDFNDPGLYIFRAGQKLETPSPSMPSQQQENYRREIIKNMAAAVGSDYSTLSGDLERTTYSSARHGLLQSRDCWRAHQRNMESKVLKKIIGTWLEWVYANGTVRLIGGRRTIMEAMASPWRHRGFPWIDPARDAVSIKTKMAMAITSPQREAMAQGESFLDLLDEIAEAKQLMTEKNLLPADIHALAGISSGATQDPPPQQEDKDDK